MNNRQNRNQPRQTGKLRRIRYKPTTSKDTVPSAAASVTQGGCPGSHGTPPTPNNFEGAIIRI